MEKDEKQWLDFAWVCNYAEDIFAGMEEKNLSEAIEQAIRKVAKERAVESSTVRKNLKYLFSHDGTAKIDIVYREIRKLVES